MDEDNNAQAAPKSNKMPLYLGSLALLLIGGGAFFFMSNSRNNVMRLGDTKSPTVNESIDSTVNETMDTTNDENSMKVDEGSIKTFEVKGSPFKFDPSEIKVKKGDKVRIVYTNTGGMHDWVIDEFDARTKILESGQSETIEFVADRAGTFEYYCSVGNHRQMGMVGNLVVEE